MRLLPQPIALVTRTGTRAGAVLGAPQALRSLGSGAVAQAAPDARPTARRTGSTCRRRPRAARAGTGSRRGVGGTSSTAYRDRSERAAGVEWRPREPLPEARRAHPRDRSRAGHDRGHRARHGFGPRLPGLAALPRPDHPVARRHQGLDRVDPPDRRGRHRLRDPRPRLPGHPRLPRPPIDPLAVAGGGRARRLPGVARARDGPPRQQRRVGHGAPGRGPHAGRVAGLPDRPGRLPGQDRRPRWQPAIHARRGLRHGPHVRPAPVRIARDGHVVRPGLPGLAADERDAVPGRDRRDVGAHPPPLGGGHRGSGRGRPRGRRVADPARRTRRSSACPSGPPCCSRSRSSSAAHRC